VSSDEMKVLYDEIEAMKDEHSNDVDQYAHSMEVRYQYL
jgi:hypothetical protein